MFDYSLLLYLLIFAGLVVLIWRLNKKTSDGMGIEGVVPDVSSNYLSKLMGTQKKGTPMLDRFSRDLTSAANKGELDPLVGRHEEVKRVIQILSRRTKNNAILVGQAGTGKTAIAEGLALEIASGKVPKAIMGKRVLALNLGGMLAGTQYRGEFEQRMKVITDELVACGRTIILFIDEIHNLAQAGEATGAIGAANLLKPALARGDIQAVGATTIGEYYKYIIHDTSLERRFQPVWVKEPTPEETLLILKGLRPKYEKHHGVVISDEILEAILTLSAKYLTDRYFPDKAVDLMDEAASKAKLAIVEQKMGDAKPSVSLKDLEEVIFMWSRDMDQLKKSGKLINNQ